MLRAGTLTALCALAGGPLAAASAGPVAYVELLAEVEAPRTQLVLGDIARIDAAADADRALLERVPICFAPVPGHTRQVTSDYVMLKLRRELPDAHGVRIAGAPLVHIVSPTSVVAGGAIVDAVTAGIREAMPWGPEESAIVPPRHVRDLTVGADEPTIEVAFDESEDFLGSTLARVRIYAAGELIDVAAYRFHVALFREVYHARTPIGRGEMVTAPHLRTERVDVADLHGKYFDTPEAVIGLQARRTIPRGTRLTEAMLQAPPVVSRGDRVRVNVSGEQFDISMVGEARETGALGHVIRVDLPNRHAVYARVAGPGQVRLVQ